MPETPALPAEILLSKRVQEMALNGEEPPKLYVYSDIEATQEYVNGSQDSEIPIINLSLLSSSKSIEEENELEKLKFASHPGAVFSKNQGKTQLNLLNRLSVIFNQAVGHGIPSSFLNKIRQVTKEFFEQPMEEKQKYSKGVEEFEGYGGDPVPADGQPLDWSDRLFLDVFPHDTIKPKFWPENPKYFRDVLDEYTLKTKALTEIVSKAMAKSLNLEENCSLNQFGDRGTLQARFNYYSCCQASDRVLGLKPHADGSGYTIILQDVEGLQILKDGNWFTVPVLSEALLVLMGDQMEIMSNGMFKSPVHRVLANSERERISVAMFYTPEPKKEIGPEGGLINEDRPKLYKEVKDYADLHWEYYQKGSRAIHTAQV